MKTICIVVVWLVLAFIRFSLDQEPMPEFFLEGTLAAP
jgi:hypothetical protein